MSSASTAAARRRLTASKPIAFRLPRPRRSRVIAGLVVLAALGAGYWFWFRDSSLVAVNNVDVVGVTTGDRDRLTAELTDLAEKMTTLDVDTAKLESAARAYPTVDSIAVDADFPHGLRIEVTERPPVIVVTSGGKRMPAAADGTLLPDVEVPDGGLPTLELKKPPPAGGLDGAAADQAVIAGAAPEPLRPLIHTIEHTPDHGIVATLRGGIPLYFGTAAEAPQKWAAAAAVLADPKLQTLTYLDVRVPRRPAAGGAATSLPATADSQP
ncbi:MAG: cell division protein FtsQ/DivIB [Solirubrobacterales bacterium]